MPIRKIKKASSKMLKNRGIQILKTDPSFFERAYQEMYNEKSLQERKFYNISAGGHFGFGCGFSHPYWTNVDADFDWGGGVNYNQETDIAHDLMDEGDLPIESATAELAYSRLSIEHLPNSAVEKMFSEVHRILKPGGAFRIVCPDIDLDVRALLNNDRYFYDWADATDNLRGASLEQLFLDHFAASVSEVSLNGGSNGKVISDDELKELIRTKPIEEVLDYCISLIDVEFHKKNRIFHMNWWNYAKTSAKLKEAGFKTVYKSAPWQSAKAVMRDPLHFDDFGNRVMLFVEAIKE